MGDWGTDEVDGSSGDPTWMTADECVGAHGVDPMRVSTGRIRSKLARLRGGALVRVWLEDDVRRVAGEVQASKKK